MGRHYPEGEEPDEATYRAALAEVIRCLEGSGLRYLFMGGVGAAAMARPRATDDIDLFVHPEDARAVLDRFRSCGFVVEETDPSWLFKARCRGVLIDVIFRSSGDVYLDDEMLERAQLRPYKGEMARLVSPEDLLVIKAVASAEHRPHHWYDALALLARGGLDGEYLVMRAARCGPRRVLSLLLYAESNDIAVPREAVERLVALVAPRVAPLGGASPTAAGAAGPPS